MTRFKTTVLVSIALLIGGVFITSFITGTGKVPACEDIVYGYYNVSGGSSDPHVNHPWNSCSGSYSIQGLDPRTVELYPSFGGGSPYTFTKLSSYPSSLSLGTVGGFKAYCTFTSQGQSMTIQVTKGAQTQVVSFAFTP